MPAITFIKKKDIAFNEQLKLFAGNIDTVATGLGVTPSEVNSIKADALYFNYVVKTAYSYKSHAKAMTSFKIDARKGKKQTIDLLFPPPYIPDPPPPAVKPGIQNRFSKLCRRIKSSRNYNSATGAGLGIEAVRPHFDIQAGKPKLDLQLTGGHVRIKYKRGKYEGIQIWKNTGSGFSLLATANHSVYFDESKLPPFGQSAIWKYKAIYLYKDKNAGEWSDETSITVMG